MTVLFISCSRYSDIINAGTTTLTAKRAIEAYQYKQQPLDDNCAANRMSY